MWGHLKDVGFKVDLKSIVNAVAPPVESDDDDEYETDGDGDDDSQDDDIVSVDENEPVETEAPEEYEDDEDEDEYEEDQPRGFGLVGMLSRALDSEQHRYEDSQSHEEEQEQDLFEQEEVADINPIVSTSMSSRSFYSDSLQGGSMLNESYTDIDMQEEDNHHQASYLEQAQHFPEQPHEEPAENLAADPAANPAAVRLDSSEKEAPVRRSLVRETGSLSPADAYARRNVQVPLPSIQPLEAEVSESTTKEQKISEGENISAASPKGKDGESAPTAVRKSRLPTPNKTKRSERAAPIASTTVNTPTARVSPPLPASRVPPRSPSDMQALDNLPGLPSFIAPGPEQLGSVIEQNRTAAPTEKDADSNGSSNKSISVVKTATTASAAMAERAQETDLGQNDKPASASPPNETPGPPLGSQDEAVVDDDDDEDTQSLERGNLGSQHDALVRGEAEEEELTNSFGEEGEEEIASASLPNETPAPPLGSQDEAVVDDDDDTQSLERGNLGSQHDVLVIGEAEDEDETNSFGEEGEDEIASASLPNETRAPLRESQDGAVVNDDDDTQALERRNLGSQHDALIRVEAEEEETNSFGEEGEEETQSLGEGEGQWDEQNTPLSSVADPEMRRERRPSVSEKPTVQKMPKLVEGETTQPEDRSKELERELRQAEVHIVELQQQAARQLEMEEENQQRQMQRFQEKEVRLLEAAAEDQEQELGLLRNDMDSRFAALQQERDIERKELVEERDQMERLLNEAISTVDAAEREKKQARSKQDNDSAQFQQRQERSLRMAEDKLAQTMALLDDREDQVENLNATVKNLKSKMSVHQEGAHEAEEELDELHTENETLRHHVQTFEAQCAELKSKVSELEGESDKVSGLKIELRMLREELDREKSKKKSFAASAESSTAQLESERDVAQAGVQDLRQQLSAALADIEVARSDTNRVMMANNNLQSALEAFQSEREAELSMLEEQRLEAEQATAAAHAAALEATREANAATVREIQQAADGAVKNSMNEVEQLEAKSEKYRMENIQMRRSLDEAINRLQSTQEDVIDRTLMKNILLDWLTKASSKDKKPILEVMASVLHFTDEEKERVNIEDTSHALRKAVMGRVAAPFPPTKADMEHLEGDNVREKWVNFLLAETNDD